MVLLDPLSVFDKDKLDVLGLGLRSAHRTNQLERTLIRLYQAIQSLDDFFVESTQCLVTRKGTDAIGGPVLKMGHVAGVKDPADELFDHQAIRMMAVVLVAAGKTIVKSPSVEVLSEPKSSAHTAAFVSVVFAFELADGVLL